MLAAYFVVAIGADEEKRHVTNAPADDAHQVERRLICPVQILEHDQRRQPARLSKQRQKRIENSIPVHCVERFSQGTVDLVGDVDQGSEGPSRNDGIARAPEDTDLTCHIRAEGLNERCLADAGLALDEQQTPRSAPALAQ